MKGNTTGPLKLIYDHEEGHINFTIFRSHVLGERITGRIGKEKATITKMNRTISQDNFGVHEELTFYFQSQKNQEKRFIGSIRVYDNFAVFDALSLFEIKEKKDKSLFDHPYISFPCFEGEFQDDGSTMISFKCQAPFNYPVIWHGRVTDSIREGKNVPLIITNSHYRTVILSPLTNLLYGTVSISPLSQMIRCGIPRALKKIPQGTVHRTIMVWGEGVNATIDKWGKILRTHHGAKAVRKDSDVSLKYISYWTNAGAAYWYNTYKKKDYDDTLRKLREHHEAVGLSFGSYQLDSWWYRKEGESYTSGITEWEPKKVTMCRNFNSIFPFLQHSREIPLFMMDRMSYVQSILKKPIGCHFKQLSNTAVYVGENKDHFICEEFAMPKNKEAAKKLFREVFTHPNWRLAYIVHDWLQWMNDRHSVFRDFFIGPGYFEALDEVCREISNSDNSCGHLTVQLCMSQPHMTLNSVTMASVTSIRSTSDSNSFFIEGTRRWWWHLYSSRFIQALGKYAFYDNRLTFKSHIHPLSPYSKFEMIWLGLSCGPIGIGDPIGKENIELIRRVVKEDGEIIKPDVPSVPLDQCYLFNPNSFEAEHGVTVYSYSAITREEGNPYKVYYILTFNVHPFGRRVRMNFRLREAGAEEELYALYDYFSEELKIVPVCSVNTFIMQRRRFYYHIAAPVERGIAFLGNRSKYVTCSKQLVRKIAFGDRWVIAQVYSEECILKSMESQKGTGISKIIAVSNRRKKKMNDASEWLFYCCEKPKGVFFDGTPADFSWENAVLSVREKISGSNGNNNCREIMIHI